MPWNNATDYKPSGVAVEHGLGYVPIVQAYFMGDGDADLAVVDFAGEQMPTVELGAVGGGAGIVAKIYYTVDYQFITFTRQSLETSNANSGTKRIKYYLLSQPANA